MQIIKGETHGVTSQLDALPEGAIVRDARGSLWEKVRHKWSLGGFDGVGLRSEGVGGGQPIQVIFEPAVREEADYSEPQVIGIMPNYVEDRLDELNEGAVILDRDGEAWQKSEGNWYLAGGGSGGLSSFTVGHCQPFRVIWEGGE